MNLEEGARLATIIQAFCSVVIGFATVSILLLTYKINLQNRAFLKQSKQADVLSEFNARHSKILDLRENPDIKNNPIIYYERFWSLQFDQFRYWRKGFVLDEDFRYWMNWRHDEWIANRSVGNISYREGFNHILDQWKHHEFMDFMDCLHRKGVAEAFASLAPITSNKLESNK